MGIKIRKCRQNHPDDNEYHYKCPGCGYMHGFKTNEGSPGSPKWTFNGDYEKPSLTPSMNVGPKTPKSQCHHFVEEGKIRFLNDCWHSLKGQTVELPDIGDDDDW